ncbi:MAG: TIR domain-containing protein [Planctomycetales bacterium]|nr:TIR domain-containing protein [Planctomycetales bacterium]
MATAKSAFISYRRKDTADISGRLFDRLSGYFSSENVLLDVDALVSGSNYRTQIEQLLERCNVVLAVIGQEWLTVQDDQGRRRIDDPDDQLRIEIEVALKSGHTVIPVLVHDAGLPTADQLPEALRALADLEPHFLQSGLPFNTDIELLIERLAEHGLHPPESAFPWHTVLLPLGIGAVLLSLFTYAWTPLGSESDYALQQLAPESPIQEIIENTDQREELFTLDRFDRELFRFFCYVNLPLALGPLLIVWGKRLCCLNGERLSAQRHYAQGAGRLPTPKSTKSVWCLALGLASISLGLLSAIPSLIVGAAAWRELRIRRSWMRGRSLVVAGVLVSLVGGLVFGYLHYPNWMSRSWIAAMEKANAAEAEQQAAAAEGQFGAALAVAHTPIRKAVTRVRRGQNLAGQNRDSDAVADLTYAIDSIETYAASSSTVWRGNLIPILKAARLQRAEIYERLGRDEEAEEDRDWNQYTWNPGEEEPPGMRPLVDEAPPPPAPVAPEPPAPIAPPAEDEPPPPPVIDPSA